MSLDSEKLLHDLTRREFLMIAGLGASSALLMAMGRGAVGPEACDGEPVQGPLRSLRRGSDVLQPLSWSNAAQIAADYLQALRPSEIAFLVRPHPSHSAHFMQILARSLGGASVIFCDPESDLDGFNDLQDAARLSLGSPQVPLFDLSSADLVFSFGSNFHEPWISPQVDISPAAHIPERLSPARVVHFSARKPKMSDRLIDWVPIRPGSQAYLAATLYMLASEMLGCNPQTGQSESELKNAALRVGLKPNTLRQMAARFVQASRHLALPGAEALASPLGTKAGVWILALNLLNTLPSQSAGFFLPPPAPLFPLLQNRPSSAAELEFLVRRIQSGKVKLLIYHGIDPLEVLPNTSIMRKALAEIPRLISLSPFFGPSKALTDLFLPDHPQAETWGYDLPLNRMDWGLIQTIVPERGLHDLSPSSIDVLLDVSRKLGLNEQLSYRDQSEFLQASVCGLIHQDGILGPADADHFFNAWKNGGVWQREKPVRFPPQLTLSIDRLAFPEQVETDLDALNLQFFSLDEVVSPNIRNSAWAELHPDTAARFRLISGQRIQLITEAGAVQLTLKINSELQPAAVAVPIFHGDLANRLLLGGHTPAGGNVYSGRSVKIGRTETS